MKKGLIVLNSYRDLNQNKYKVDRLKEEFSKFSIGLDVLKSTQLNIVLKDGKVTFSGSTNQLFDTISDDSAIEIPPLFKLAKKLKDRGAPINIENIKNTEDLIKQVNSWRKK